jgi:4-diphosphocytidyl-2-C-methyl-D-erythritol kinase
MAETGTIHRFAPAKVNLSLQITGRRADGYHTLDGLIAFAGVGDWISAQPADRFELVVTGPFAAPLQRAEAEGENADNLVLQAARRLAAFCGITSGARLTLHKALPVAAGLGGGSADAAAALAALCALWECRPDPAEMARLGLSLGADVPICQYGRPAFVGGIGEDIMPAPPLPPAWLVLVNPGVAVPTGAVFKARSGPYSAAGAPWTRPPTDARELAAWLSEARNDLEAPARQVAPIIAETLAAIGGTGACLLARMSGSGATCFGLYATADGARCAAASLAAQQPGWWVEAAPLGTEPSGD